MHFSDPCKVSFHQFEYYTDLESCLTYFLCTDYFAKQFSKQLRYDRSTQYSNSVAKQWFQSKGNKLKEKINGLIFLKPHLISKFIERQDTVVFIQISKSRTKLNNMYIIHMHMLGTVYVHIKTVTSFRLLSTFLIQFELWAHLGRVICPSTPDQPESKQMYR